MKNKGFKKLSRKLLTPLIYIAVFWIFMDILPNTAFNAGPVSKIIAAAGFYIAYHSGLLILKFFKLRNNVIARFLMSSATTSGYLYLLDKYFPDILNLNPTYIGNTNLVAWQIPKLIEITDIYTIYIFSALILVFCCLIIEVSFKRN